MSRNLFKQNDKEKVQTTNLLIIDASGSMSDKKQEVRGGIKQILSKIKEDAINDKDTVLTRTIVVDFSGHNDIRVIMDESDSCNINDTISDKYKVRGMTALFDAIVQGFGMVNTDKTFVNIITDGLENASQKNNYNQVKELITGKKSAGWGIVFMGTSKEALKQAEGMGVTRGNTMQFTNDAAGASAAFGKSLKARSSYNIMSVAATYSMASEELSKGINMDNLIADEDKNEELVKEIKAKKETKKDK